MAFPSLNPDDENERRKLAAWKEDYLSGADVSSAMPSPAAAFPPEIDAPEFESFLASTAGPQQAPEDDPELAAFVESEAAKAPQYVDYKEPMSYSAKDPERKRRGMGDGDKIALIAAGLGSVLQGKPMDTSFWSQQQQRRDRLNQQDEANRLARERIAAQAARRQPGEMTPTQLAAQERTERTRRLWDPNSEESQRARAAYIQAGGDPALVDGRSFAEMDGDPAVRATIQRATEEIRGDKGAEEYDRRAAVQFRDWARRNNIDENDARARTIFEDAIARARKMDEEERAATREAPKVEATAAKDYGEELRARGVTRARAALDSVLEEMRLQGIDIDAALADPSVVKSDVPGYGQTGMAPTAMLSPEGKNMRRAVKRLLDTELRVATGAAAPPSEQDTFASILGVGRMDTDRDLISALAQAKRVLDLQEGYVKEMFPSAPQAKKPSGPRAPKPSGAPPSEPLKTYRHTAKNGKQFEYPLTEKQAAAMRAKGFVLDEVQ